MSNSVTLTSAVQALVVQTQAANTTQQLALDASNLLSCTADRYKEFSGAGFFKRFWYAVNGKNGEITRANVKDLAKMQEIAFLYLTELQQQNLLLAESIAVIRNNLKDLAFEATETRAAVLSLVAKFQERHKHLVEDVAILKWSRDVVVRPYVLSETRPLHLFLRLVFDYLHLLLLRTSAYDDSETEQSLRVAMLHLKLDAAREYSIEEFAKSLVKEIGVDGTETFRHIVALTVEGQPVSAGFILDNVTGVGYNTLYMVADVVSKITAALPYLDMGWSEQEVAGKLSDAVCKHVSHPGASYTLLELGCEIVGGSLIAQDIFASLAGLKPEPEPEPEIEAVEAAVDDVLAPSPISAPAPIAIKTHDFLTTDPSRDEKDAYIRSLGILFVYSGGPNEAQCNYLRCLCKLFDIEDGIEKVQSIAAAHEINLQPILDLLQRNTSETATPLSDSTPNLRSVPSHRRQFAWLVDALFLGCTSGKLDPEIRGIIESVSKGMGMELPPDSTFRRSIIAQARDISISNDEEVIFNAILELDKKSHQWRTLLEYRQVSLVGPFSRLEAEVRRQAVNVSLWSAGMAQDVQRCISSIAGVRREREKKGLDGWLATSSSLEDDGMKLEKKMNTMIVSLYVLVERGNGAIGLFGAAQPSRPLPSRVFITLSSAIRTDSRLAILEEGFRELDEARNGINAVLAELVQDLAAVRARVATEHEVLPFADLHPRSADLHDEATAQSPDVASL